MTTVKTEKKNVRTEAKQEELQIAHEIHTLSQIFYGELARTRPWAGPTLPTVGFPPAAGPATPPMTGPVPHWTTPHPWCW